jgi:hypothetical protein
METVVGKEGENIAAESDRRFCGRGVRSEESQKGEEGKNGCRTHLARMPGVGSEKNGGFC